MRPHPYSRRCALRAMQRESARHAALSRDPVHEVVNPVAPRWPVRSAESSASMPTTRSRGAQVRVVKNGTSPRALPIQGGRLQPIFTPALRCGHSPDLHTQTYAPKGERSTVSSHLIGHSTEVQSGARRGRADSQSHQAGSGARDHPCMTDPPTYDRLKEVDGFSEDDGRSDANGAAAERCEDPHEVDRFARPHGENDRCDRCRPAHGPLGSERSAEIFRQSPVRARHDCRSSGGRPMVGETGGGGRES